MIDHQHPSCADSLDMVRGESDSSQLIYSVRRILDIVSRLEDRLVLGQKSHLSVDECAELVGRSSYTVRRWITTGLIRAERVSGTGPRGRLLIPREELDRVIKQGRGESISSPFSIQ